MKLFSLHTFRTLLAVPLLGLCACSSISNLFNPFYDPPSKVALLGEKNDHAISGENKREDTARKALDAMGSYQAAQAPQPNHPVEQPAVVRLMWIPDHLNHNGDLVPAHYYYVKVLSDRPAVTDAFELEAQLGSQKGGSSDIPYMFSDEERGKQ
jgi:hypothetical protein